MSLTIYIACDPNNQSFFTAPTAPNNLTSVGIDRTFIDLEWSRPLEVNGESMTYQLWFNENRININNNDTMNETFSFRLNHLEPYKNYTITVVACTSDCSSPSESLTLETKMGIPGQMFQPKLEKVGGNKVAVRWEPPRKTGGNSEYFQLKLIPAKDHQFGAPRVYRINGRLTSCTIERFTCDGDKIDFIMRSVNVERLTESVNDNLLTENVNCLATPELIENDVGGHFYGEWSQPWIYHCQRRISMTMVAAFFILAFGSLLSIYLFIRFYQRYKEMKDIHIVWPKGLDLDSLSPSSNKHPDLFEAVRDLDLVKDHVLTDIEEEDEVENKIFLPPYKGLNHVVDEHSKNNQRDSPKSETLMPFICNPKTNEILYQIPLMITAGKKKGKSVPTSPLRATGYADFSSDPQIDSTGYMKMNAPQSPRNEILSASVEGYLDMRGKPRTPPITQRSSDYTSNEVKKFLNDSENNNGYIGKRAFILSDPNKKLPSTINANGYVGLQRN